MASIPRRDGRVVYCIGLENRRTERYRGFESLSLRKMYLFSISYKNHSQNHPQKTRGWGNKNYRERRDVNLRFPIFFVWLWLGGVVAQVVKAEVFQKGSSLSSGSTRSSALQNWAKASFFCLLIHVYLLSFRQVPKPV